MENKILKTAMELIVKNGWSELSFTDIAIHANVSLDQVRDCFSDKNEIINSIARLIDKETLQNIEKFADSDTYRDKLFSVLMTRFDVLANYKDAIKRLWADACQNPMMVLHAAPQGANSMMWMLEAAQIDVSGSSGALKSQLFGVFYLTAVNTWLQDDTQDLAPTMAYIDRGLEKLELVPGFY